MIDNDCFKCGAELVIYCEVCQNIPDDCSCKMDEFRKDEDSDKNISEGIKLLE